MRKISIIIPTKNEEFAIAKVICSIPKKILKRAEIIVADSSNDMTPIIAKRLGAKVIKIKGGKGLAMIKAAKIARGDILVFLDGDGTDPPQLIPKLLKKLKKCDIVIAGRHEKKIKIKNPIIKAGCLLYFSIMKSLWKLAGMKFKGDPLAGFRVMRKETWKKLKLKSKDFLIESEMNIKAKKLGLKICEVFIPVYLRIGGIFSSKLFRNPKQWIKIIKYILRHAIRENKKIKRRFMEINKLWKSLRLKNFLILT
jgi:glycosyltransferase involved in cell wall biosynthesis